MADPPVDPAGEPALVSPSDLLRWAEALAGIARTGPRLHREPLRAGALRRGPEDRRRHPLPRPRGGRGRGADRGVDPQRGEGRPRLRDPQDGRRRGGRQRGRRDPARAAGRHRRVALPDRLGRHRLLAVGGGGQGGRGGDRHRGRAGVPHGRVRRDAARVPLDPAVLADLPLPDDRRRRSSPTRWSASTSASSPATTCPSPWPAAACGSTWPSRPSTAARRRPSSTSPAARPGGPAPTTRAEGYFPELVQQQVDDRDRAPVRSQASPIDSWSTSPVASGATPSSCVTEAASVPGSMSSP